MVGNDVQQAHDIKRVDCSNILKVWNTAVSEVGGIQNTRENFDRIADRFRELAKSLDYADDVIDTQIESNLEATYRFMDNDLTLNTEVADFGEPDANLGRDIFTKQVAKAKECQMLFDPIKR